VVGLIGEQDATLRKLGQPAGEGGHHRHQRRSVPIGLASGSGQLGLMSGVASDGRGDLVGDLSAVADHHNTPPGHAREADHLGDESCFPSTSGQHHKGRLLRLER
jgi:hypothetical protein